MLFICVLILVFSFSESKPAENIKLITNTSDNNNKETQEVRKAKAINGTAVTNILPDNQKFLKKLPLFNNNDNITKINSNNSDRHTNIIENLSNFNLKINNKSIVDPDIHTYRFERGKYNTSKKVYTSKESTQKSILEKIYISAPELSPIKPNISQEMNITWKVTTFSPLIINVSKTLNDITELPETTITTKIDEDDKTERNITTVNYDKTDNDITTKYFDNQENNITTEDYDYDSVQPRISSAAIASLAGGGIG